MRVLKERSGCTYRQLAERAESRGDSLARSTLSDVLRKDALPRPEILTAFVRACDDDSRVKEWLDARSRVEARGHESVPGAPVARPPRCRLRLGARQLIALAWLPALAALAAFGVWAVLSGSWADQSADHGRRVEAVSRSPGEDASTAPRLPFLGPAGGWVRLRVTGSGGCLTEGRGPDASSGPAAVLGPCSRTSPRTYLQPVGDGLYYIQWHRPGRRADCLTATHGSDQVRWLRPRTDCGGDPSTQLFHFDPVGGSAPRGYRLRLSFSALCVGLSGERSPASDRRVREEPCTGATGQLFRIETLPRGLPS